MCFITGHEEIWSWAESPAGCSGASPSHTDLSRAWAFELERATFSQTGKRLGPQNKHLSSASLHKE